MRRMVVVVVAVSFLGGQSAATDLASVTVHALAERSAPLPAATVGADAERAEASRHQAPPRSVIVMGDWHARHRTVVR